MIWLIGCKGMLGTEVSRQLEAAKMPWVGTDREVDITNPEALENFANNIETEAYTPSSLPHSERHIQWIINCSAYTNVDKAEEDTELAEKLNATGPMNIARLARKINAKLIHISTDYVFNGKGSEPYTEDMLKEPLGVYGKTKAQGEEEIQKEMNQYYILRTAWLYGFDGKNFVYTMIRAMNSHESVKVVSDQRGTPTNCLTLSSIIAKIIESRLRNSGAKNHSPKIPNGIYHVTDEGETTWFDFAKEIKNQAFEAGILTNESCLVNPCTTAEYPTPAKRPAYSVLDKSKIQQTLGIKLPQWQESLKSFIKSANFDKNRIV